MPATHCMISAIL